MSVRGKAMKRDFASGKEVMVAAKNHSYNKNLLELLREDPKKRYQEFSVTPSLTKAS